ncbi:hypothetical protein QUF54_04435 [Candidatus Marithioploca araucensis]|uniref:Uncharacterized protein n=1 Tax=Candidatus Marithioploca araucensis TaxID=70273 RepID=A0ABT7VSE2_9GAMM|nr:hypothetical protein [Candidatus Marithioploca araucensis]
MFRKTSIVMLLVLLVTLGISVESSANKLQDMIWNSVKEFVKDTAIDIIQGFLRDDVKREEFTALKGKVSDLKERLDSVKEGGYNPPDFDSVEQTVMRLTNIVNAMESRFSLLEDRVTALEKRVTVLEQDIPFVKQTIAEWEKNSESKYLPTLDTQILFPSMNSIVKRRQSIRGTISRFVSQEYYFLIIQSHHFGKLHYPQQELFSATWEAVGVYGTSNQKYGYRYDTFIVKTSKNEEAQTIRQKMGKGLKNLPVYTEIVGNKVTTIFCQ